MRSREPTTSPGGHTDSAPRCEREVLLFVVWPVDSARGIALSQGNTLIGRDPEVGIRLDDREVSRRHALVAYSAGQCEIRDLDSSNGTYVDGKRVASAKLRAGSVLRLGNSLAVIRECVVGVAHSGGPAFHATGLLGGAQLALAISPARRAASSSLPIVIEGDTGTGKERIALAIHEWSGRAGPFVAVNCAAIPEGLAEAELFGHRRGAFTGAVQSSQGYFRSAEGGTLLLDEVYSLSPAVQTKLLRALEQSEVHAVGDARPTRIDVRIIATTHEPLATFVSRGEFRSDLYARLAGVTVRAPALKERREDVCALFNHFIECAMPGRRPPISAVGIERLLLHDYPMNVRELRLIAMRVAALDGEAQRIGRSEIERAIDGGLRSAARAVALTAKGSCAETREQRKERELSELRKALASCSGNLRSAAKLTGISRQRAYRLLGRSYMDEVEYLRSERPCTTPKADEDA